MTEIKGKRVPKSKGGRPLMKVKRESHLMVRLTENERFLVEEKSKEAGMRPSEWFRQAAKKAKVIARVKPEDGDSLRMLAGLANNLNQLTRLAHKDGLITVQKKCRELLFEIDGVLKDLRSDDR
ncbi:plasmid mobilization protein [Dyadobacter frigoris]|uniref:MobC family plasmid mobilization relaxosome protein n=1 Tax=Dyadobacter frigoris TaxID=2576211 RepID=A0A4V6BJJ1_9BACT|nr:plasmid mobilization relaxosome protein MobC [Dyadobacter frigoris]TKT94053.1 MobC family plasmid mobilization relaxosome protein [Dyadobacter frigoris]